MSNYIMPEDLFNQLCLVRSFNKANGATYQEHILIVAGKRNSQGPPYIDI